MNWAFLISLILSQWQVEANKDHPNLRHIDVPQEYCRKAVKTCQVLENRTCMGVKLPYSSTSLDLVQFRSQEEVYEKLKVFEYFRFVPKCWAVIQPFICALYLPKCDKSVNGSLVDLPSREMCKIALHPCKLFFETDIFRELGEFLDCEDESLFRPKCRNDVLEMKFNISGVCMDPLVQTDQADWSYPRVEGCGLRCKDSLYTETEHNQIHKLIGYCVLLCAFLNAFTIATFLIDWSTANKYPALTIFYMNLCFLISYGGWSIQFLGTETREDVVCKRDGTLRKWEPSASENLSCVVVFVMVYYFLIAGLVWFVIFSYTWHMSSLQALGKIRDRVDKKRAYFHLVAWSLPLVLTIATMALGEIEGDYVTGICFVSSRAGLLLTPLSAAILSSSYIAIRGLVLLIRVKIDSKEIISDRSSRKIRSNIVRMGVFALFMVIFYVITAVYHVYFVTNYYEWERSLHDYIVCKLTSFSPDVSHCKQESRPSVAMLQLQLLAVFGAGVAVASWVWCGPTLHSWARYFRKKFRCEVDEPLHKVQKHKIIAQAFAKRKIFNEGGRISIEYVHHTDPVGLHFDINSAASNGLSTTWAANLARLVNRRDAMVQEPEPESESEHSELSVKYVSIESRCNSGDSQMSIQIAELKATRKGRKRRRNRQLPKGSSSSLDSHFKLINALTEQCKTKNLGPKLDRRSGNAGLESSTNLLTNAQQFMLPYEKNKSDSDESISVSISESRFNVVLNNADL